MSILKWTLALLFLPMSIVLGETNVQLQTVDSSGHATYYKVGSIEKVVIEGIVLNNSADRHDPSYDAPVYMGGQWEIFIQGLADDNAGTSIWLGQKYANMGGVSYTESEWISELNRVSYDGSHEIVMGDLVRITGYAAEYNGKTNINERHSSSSLMDFDVEYISSPGLPEPTVITLDELKDASDLAIFDEFRNTGGELYQGRLVRIENVSFVDASLWQPSASMAITDGERTLPVLLGRSAGFSTPSNLNETFDIVGFIDQSGGYTAGYQLVVTQYNGGANYIGVSANGDANSDGRVDVGDLGILAANYGTTSDANFSMGDFNGDGAVDVGDLGILAAHYGYGTSGSVDFDADYAEVFAQEEAGASDWCSTLGLTLIASLALMGLMLVKFDD